MAPKATVIKVELQVSDLDRNYYASHHLTLAQHPSETDKRLMVRLLTFALYADARLAFGRGLSSEDEPDLWRRDDTGLIEQWIELGQPDESRIKKACSRAQHAIVVSYGGHASDIWWAKLGPELARRKNLQVIDIPAEAVDALAALIARNLSVNCMIQDGELHVSIDADSISVRPTVRMPDPHS